MKLKVILISIFIILNMILFFITEMVKQDRIENSLEKHLHRIQTDYNTLKYHQGIIVQNILESTQKTIVKSLKELKKASDKKQEAKIRKELYNKLIKEYKRVKKSGVYQFQIMLPDNRTFLRVHKPEKFDDDLSKIRYTYAYTNKNRKPIEGFEGGKTTHAYRYVNPIFDENGNYMGAIESSFSSEYLQRYLTKISMLHTHFIVNKKVFSKKTWERDDIKIQYKQSAEHDDFMLIMSEQHSIENCLVKNGEKLKPLKNEIKVKIEEMKPFSFYTKHNDSQSTHEKSPFYKHKDETHVDVVTFLPIKSSTGENLAWLVSHVPDDNILLSLKGSFYVRVVLFILLAILFYFAFKILNQKKVLEYTVKEKTKELQKLNEGLEEKIKEEIEKNRKNQLKLLEKSKMSSLGEMIGNIAHQWRQPLNVISTSSSALQMKYALNSLDKENMEKLIGRIDKNVQYLSDTIDTFRNFIKDDKTPKKVILQDTIKSSLNIIDSGLKSNYIDLYHNLDETDPIEYTLIEGEFNQVIINIINNAKDILKEKEPENPWIKLHIEKDDKEITVSIEDNAGGIPKNILSKIFEPYFTTKHQSQGTGLGLHMSYEIVTGSLKGELTAVNSQNGALFLIKLPTDEKK